MKKIEDLFQKEMKIKDKRQLLSYLLSNLFMLNPMTDVELMKK